MALPVGSKRVTLSQVAERAGVSVMTASYTFNRPGRVSAEARARVLAAAADLGYAGPDPSARSLRRGSTRTLGVVLGEHLSYAFEDPGATSFLAGVAEVCADHGYGMTILPITGAVDDVARISDAAVDGFVVWTTSDDDPVLAAVQARKRPAVVHGGPAVGGLDLVSIDNRAAARAIGALAFAGAERLGRREPAAVAGAGQHDHHRRGPARRPLPGHPGPAGRLPAGRRGRRHRLGRRGRRRSAPATTRSRPSASPPRCWPRPTRRTRSPRWATSRRPGWSAPPAPPVAASPTISPSPAGTTRSWRPSSDLTTVAQSLREQGAACARAALGEDVRPAHRRLVAGPRAAAPALPPLRPHDRSLQRPPVRT